MKILWVEDFGGGLAASKIVIEMFKGFISPEVFDNEYDPDEDVTVELPRLFEEHTLHHIYICKSYLEWKETFLHHNGDFDIALIDINLEAYKTSENEMPIETPDFDKKAGFYIYHRLIKDGFPDDNIAFFTGETSSLNDFIKSCQEVLLDSPANTFEKKPSDFEKLRDWLTGKENEPYLTLRRGIIEACWFLKGELAQIEDSELEKYLLFYKTTPLKIEEQPTNYRTEVLECLTSLEQFFTSNRRSDRHQILSLFVKELAKYWGVSSGFFDKNKPLPLTESRLEGNFYRTCQIQMKTLRNWSTHNLISDKINEKNVAYFFMIAMRALLKLNFQKIYPYEQILASLFEPLTIEEADDKIQAKMERYLYNSYKALEEKVAIKPNFNSQNNYFIALLKNYGEEIARSEGVSSYLITPETQTQLLILLYQSFWHGVFPSWLQLNKRSNLLTVHFDVEPLLSGSFPYFLGRLIFKESFKE